MHDFVEELKAQVEQHGWESVTFHLEDRDDENAELFITNITYEDNKVKVTLQ